MKSFPIDTLKIDRSFVAEMLTDHTTASIVEAIVSMTRILGLSVLAEGVEDQSQFAFLQQLGCDAVQGFYISAAVPADEFAKLLHHVRRRCAVARTPAIRGYLYALADWRITDRCRWGCNRRPARRISHYANAKI